MGNKTVLFIIFIVACSFSIIVFYSLDDISKFNTQKASLNSSLPTIIESSDWKQETPLVSEWYDSSDFKCNVWKPEASTIPEGKIFRQFAYDCSVEQYRMVQNQEVNTQGIYRDVGDVVIEKRLSTNQFDSRFETGTQKQ